MNITKMIIQSNKVSWKPDKQWFCCYIFADNWMDAATALYLAKGILDFSVLSTSLSYEEILAIKAALPSMELTP